MGLIERNIQRREGGKTSLLRQIMKRLKLNQREVADILDVRPWLIGAWLLGERDICNKHINKLATMLLVERKELIPFAIAQYESERIMNALSICQKKEKAPQ